MIGSSNKSRPACVDAAGRDSGGEKIVDTCGRHGQWILDSFVFVFGNSQKVLQAPIKLGGIFRRLQRSRLWTAAR